MYYTDVISKNFLTGSGQFINVPGGSKPGVSRWESTEDQTYLGFFIHFSPPILPSDYLDFDYLPQGLLMVAGEPGTIAYNDSAISFLKRRKEPYRAAMMEEFREGILTIASKTPWMFTKITGVGDLWKIDPKNSWRTKEKKIVIDCLETLDLKMTYLVDLYRKASYDAAYMRWILPDCQRYFAMDIVVSEIRTMQNPGGGPLNTATFHQYRCDYCEFDFFSEEPGYLNDLSSSTTGTAATVKLPIKIGKVTEMNSYGLLGAYLQDTYYAQDRDDTQRKESFVQGITTQKDVTGEGFVVSADEFGPLRNEEFIQSLEDQRIKPVRDSARTNSLGEGAIALGGAGTGRPEFKPSLNPLLSGALSAVTNAINTAINGAVLGNVYGFSASNLIGNLQGLLNNPVGAVQGLLQNNGMNAQTAAAAATKVELTGPEIKIIKDLIGKANEVANLVAGTNLETSTIGDLIQGIEASEKLQGVPSSVDLQAPAVSSNGPQKVNFESAGAPGTIDPIRLVLQSSNASLDGPTGKTIFTGPSSDIAGKAETVEFTGGGQTELGEKSVEFEAPSKSDIGNKVVQLLDNGATLDGELSKVDLVGFGSIDATELGEESLNGAITAIDEELVPRNIGFDKPDIRSNTLGKADL